MTAQPLERPRSTARKIGPGWDWDFALHSGQDEVFHHPARIKCIATGRRWGKSILGAFWLIVGAMQDDRLYRGGKSWVVTPTYDLGKPIFEACLDIAPKTPAGKPALIFDGDSTTSPNRSIRIGRSLIEFRSAERPGSLVGSGLRRLLMDECAQIPQEAYQTYLRPTLLDFKAPVMMISSPRGRNWFWRRWKLGQVYPNKHDVAAFHGYSWENPWLDLEEIKSARGDMTERSFQQEIEGEFLTDGVGIFAGIQNCFADASTGFPKVIGVDLARKVDSTVLFGLDDAGRWTMFSRWNRRGWERQTDDIAILSNLLWETYHRRPLFVVDGTGVGDPIIASLEKKGVSVKPFIFTQQSKVPLIESWALALEQRAVTVPGPEVRDGRIFIEEHESFDVTLSELGRPKYSAPEGQHDDCVIAAALAWHGLRHGATLGAASGAIA